MSQLLIGLSAALVFASDLSPPAAFDGKGEVCHVTGSGSVRLLSVGAPAVIAHLAHHDDYLPQTWYTDIDGDGYGDETTGELACEAPDGTVTTGGDPDDADSTVYPGATDVCDGVDNDADAETDEDALDGARLLTRVGSDLALLDPVAGTSETLSSLSSSEVDVTGVNALATDPLTGQILAVEKNTDQLVSIDPCTGQVEVIGPIGLGNVCGISFGPDGVLYGIDNTNDALVTIDPVTGAGAVVGALGFNLVHCGLAYDCAADTLYGLHINKADDESDTIFSVDPSTGAATAVLTLDPTVSWNQAGLEADVSNGVFYVGMAEGLAAVDATTGAAEIRVSGSMDSLGWYAGTCE